MATWWENRSGARVFAARQEANGKRIEAIVNIALLSIVISTAAWAVCGMVSEIRTMIFIAMAATGCNIAIASGIVIRYLDIRGSYLEMAMSDVEENLAVILDRLPRP